MLPVLTLTLLKQNLTLIKRIFFRRHFKFSLKLIQTGLFYCRSWLVRIFDKFYSAVWNLSSWGWSNDSVVMGTCCSSRRPGGLVPPVPRGLTPSSDLWGHCTHMVPRHRWRQNPHTHKAIIKKKIQVLMESSNISQSPCVHYLYPTTVKCASLKASTFHHCLHALCCACLQNKLLLAQWLAFQHPGAGFDRCAP